VIDSLYIAWKYVSFNKVRTATLVACVTLIAMLPLSLNLLLDESERQLLSRADSTPLLVGARGSALDLVMNSLYFSGEVPEYISLAAADQVMDSALAIPLPLYVRFQARGQPVVGATLDYFDFRGLKIAEGRQLAVLGECILGAAVAEKLGLRPGDALLTSPETVFDLAGVYPLKMRVAGVLKRAHTSDDLAVFVDIKTAWVIQGLGHGHEDVSVSKDTSVIMDRTNSNVVASPKLMQYNEITDANIDSFHFHGDASQYPVSAVIVLPHDERSGTILRGRYLDQESRFQIVEPRDVIAELLSSIFRIKRVLDGVIFVVGVATLLALVLVFALSLRLRECEINTIFKLGGSRATIARLLVAEIAIIALISGVLCAGIMLVVDAYATELVRAMIVR